MGLPGKQRSPERRERSRRCNIGDRVGSTPTTSTKISILFVWEIWIWLRMVMTKPGSVEKRPRANGRKSSIRGTGAAKVES